MKDRLLKFLNQEQLTYARFAEIIGVQPSSISHILSGRNKPGFDFIRKILLNYPSVNAEWLILGKGKMFKNENIQRELFSEDFSENSRTGGKKVSDTGVEEDIPDKNKDADNDYDAYDTDVKDKVESDRYKSDVMDGSGVTNVNKERFVEKIVIFYSDKSFIEYSPE